MPMDCSLSLFRMAAAGQNISLLQTVSKVGLERRVCNTVLISGHCLFYLNIFNLVFPLWTPV